MFSVILTSTLSTGCFDLQVGIYDELTPLFPDSKISPRESLNLSNIQVK
ncbi:MAG: hypothetical protein QF718_08170 [Phycisphaerales bacterium]|nr:hypothetical protein [Phycisphaerales bacterium]